MKLTHQQLGDLINAHSMLNTTAETLQFCRRNHTDSFIMDSLGYCSKGNAMSLHSLLSKTVSAQYDIPEKDRIDESSRED